MSERHRQASFAGFDPEEEAPPVESAAKKPLPAEPPKENMPPAEDLPIDESSLKGRTVYVIDSHSLIFQVFHAIPEMTSPHGEPVSAVFGFTRDLLYLLEVKKPDFLICAFDLPGGTFRNELFDEYKAGRGEMPEDLIPQIPAIQRLLGTLGIPVVSLPNYEADDVLATLAKTCDDAGAECYLVTGDKDCRQLLTEHVKIYNVRKDEVYDAQSLYADWGIRPDQVVDFQALVGDSVDNIPGVALIGPKIAKELLEQYDTLESVLDHAEEVSGKKRKENLMNGREIAMLCRELVRLVPDLELDVDWSAAKTGPMNSEKALELFAEYGFHSLGERLTALDVDATPAVWEADYKTVATKEDLAQLVEDLSRQSQFSFDLETKITLSDTKSVWPRWAEIVGYSFAFTEGEAYYLPVQAPDGEPCLDPAETLETLRPVLENPDIKKVGQNLKYELIVLRTAGVRLAGIGFDTMLASYLLAAGERSHSLDELAKRFLNHSTTKIKELIGTGKKQKKMDEVPVDVITYYAAEDADVPLRIEPMLSEKLTSNSLDTLFTDLEMPLLEVLGDLEFTGIRVNVDRLAELSEQYGSRLATLEAEIYELVGHEFNIASPKQLSKVLFEEQGLPILKKTKTGASTDAGVLEELAREHPLPAKIIEFRQFAKLKNTYVDALPAMVHPETGRVHTSLNQVVAATGRLSSNDPNLQNIPVRNERGREIRSAFLPGHDGWKLLAADYSQVELRVLAHFSGDEALMKAFEQDEDIHALVASQIHGVPLDEVDAEQRRRAKAVNFGVIYGQSSYGLAKSLDIDQEEAAAFIDSYFDRYPRVDSFLAEVLEECLSQGYVTTLAGRRRKISGVRSNRPIRQLNMAERTAVNTVIQGSAADLIKQAMLALYRHQQSSGRESRMLLQIHDELIFEVPPNEVDEMIVLVRDEMSAAAKLTVPLKVDVTVGDNWAEVH